MKKLLLKRQKHTTDRRFDQTLKNIFHNDSKASTLKINLEHVDKVYDNGIKAIDNLNLEINHGEFIVLLGPSGCGKTTLLRMISGLESISDGYLKFNNVIMNDVSPKNRNIAMVFQNYALYPFMTVYKNIAFGLKNKARNNPAYKKVKHQIKVAKNSNYEKITSNKAKIAIVKSGDNETKDQIIHLKRSLKIAKIRKDTDEINKTKKELTEFLNKQKQLRQSVDRKKVLLATKAENAMLKKSGQKNTEKLQKLQMQRRKIIRLWHQAIPQKIESVTKMLDIEMYTKRKPAELSGGQRQRVALARAISKRTDLFMYDEPLSNLDAKLRAKMRSEIREIHDKIGSTSIYVTHDQIEAMSMADKIVVMNKGYIQQYGTPMQLLNDPANLFVAKFIGNTDINIFEAKYGNENIFKIKDQQVKISNSPSIKKIDWTKNKKVILAFRPEHVIVDPQIVQNAKENKFAGIIEKIELLGNEALVRLKTKEIGHISLMVPSLYSIKLGTSLEFVIDANKINIFNQENGFNLLKSFDNVNATAKQVWIDGLEERQKNQLILYRQKNRLKFSQLLRAYVQSSFSRTARERILAHKSKPTIAADIVAK